MGSEVSRLITHSGSFHADDLFSYVVLSGLFPGARLVRTRDDAVLTQTQADDIVFDVGMKFSAEERRYDHHQRDKPSRPDGAPYSALGLIWKHHGHDYLKANVAFEDKGAVERIWDRIDKDFIYFIDCADNGVYPEGVTRKGTTTSISLMIEHFNPVFDDTDADYDRAFKDAAGVCRKFLDARIKTEAAYERARKVVLAAIEETSDPRVIELPRSLDWNGHVFDIGNQDVLYAIYPAHGNWYCSAAKAEIGSFENRKSLPEEWAGLRGAELVKATNVDDAVFCHEKLFVCVAESREGILDMMRQALDYGLSPTRKP
ncbi:MYG1 family protein [Rhizobium sp. MHM7A]|uniref:MYG1 family protein n=1 Tax=Rhizobium sp. MHM7A TaxID=2583233 RepID=UPI001107161C|nr:MYG1 family protein [Rhizobium sp. MHM7A]TLX16856.1 MYG1 family protein [Rhizobium sp. MHM7A]